MPACTEIHNLGCVFYAKVSDKRASLIKKLYSATAKKDAPASRITKSAALISPTAKMDWLKAPVEAGDIVKDVLGKQIGTIKEVQTGIAQSLLIVTMSGDKEAVGRNAIDTDKGISKETSKTKARGVAKETLIPLVKEFVAEHIIANNAPNTLIMQLPDGLLDINCQS